MFLFQLNITDEDDTVADQGEGEDPRKYNKISELCITDEEMAVVDKIYSSMGQGNKKIVMPAVYQAMIDCWRGVKTYRQMLGILAQGKASLAYRHILIMTNLPYFREMSSRFVSRPCPVIIFDLFCRAQRYLMKVNGSVCSELMTAYFFFGHTATTILGQVRYHHGDLLLKLTKYPGENLWSSEQLYRLYT